MGQGPHRNWSVVGCHTAKLSTSYQHGTRAQVRSTPAGPAPITVISIMSAYPDMNETYSVSTDIIQCREVSKRLDAGEKEVGAASHGGEGRQAGDFFAEWGLGVFVFEGGVLSADDRVAFVTEIVKIPVVRPNVLRELELSNEARADHECCDAALHAVLRRVLRQMRTVGGTAADHAAAVHVRRRVAGVHSAHVRAERHRVAVRIHLLVVEVVVPLEVGA